MTKRTVKSYTRGIPDPLQSEIDRRIETKIAKAKADAFINKYRNKIGYVRKPSLAETMLRRSVRAFSEFVSQLGAR